MRILSLVMALFLGGCCACQLNKGQLDVGQKYPNGLILTTHGLKTEAKQK